MSTLAQTQSEKLTVSITISNFSDSSVSLNWKNFSISSSNIFRKKISDTAWVSIASNLSDSSYTDTSVATDEEYEYKVEVFTGTVPNVAYGYIAYGSKVERKSNRGNILVLIDDRFTSSISSNITSLTQNLISDGWNPVIEYANIGDEVTQVKNTIDSIHNSLPLSSIYLIGHIPVPKSGQIAPDGHGDNRGAWATDLYYVGNAAEWTDRNLNYTNRSNSSMSNTPDDGKFDISEIGSSIICPISRVDFYDLPTQNKTEEQMLIHYLEKASQYKRGLLAINNTGLIDNRLVNLSEGFAANGYRNFHQLMGDNITEGSMLTELSTNSHKWTYACSYGTDSSLHNIGGVTSLRNTEYQGVFSMVIGSYLGNWDKQNNFMRSLLVDGKMLTSCWAGRPNWFFHHMGQNNPIGLSAKMTVENSAGGKMNNATTAYAPAGIGQNSIHVGLLGDLTLRQKHLPVISNLGGEYKNSSDEIDLTWSSPNYPNVFEIEIYKSIDSTNNYTLLTTLAPNLTSFTDTTINLENNYYIKYIVLDTTLSGSYYNNSLGTFLTVDTTVSIIVVPAELIRFTATKKQENAILEWSTATEDNVSHFEIEKSTDLLDWSYVSSKTAKGNSVTTQNYSTTDFDLWTGITYYRLKTIDFDGYTEISDYRIIENNTIDVSIYPNPSQDNTVYIDVAKELTNVDYSNIQVIDMAGNSISYHIDRHSNKLKLDARKGVYFIQILNQVQRVVLL